MKIRRKYSKHPTMNIGDKFGTWTVRKVMSPNVLAQCDCGSSRWVRSATLRHHTAQCRPCSKKQRKERPKAETASGDAVFAIIHSLSPLQMRYAAELIRTRRPLDDGGKVEISKADVTSAIEMARSATTEEIEQELQDLRPRYKVENWQRYQQYATPRGEQV